MSADQRAVRTGIADDVCRTAYAQAGGPETGVALVAVGGYGRGELAPYSDLDVVLVHDDGVEVGTVATDVWYPLWDSGFKIDHAVRTFSQMISAADADVRVALGLLDIRHLAGDSNLTLRLRTTVLAGWRRTARERLGAVHSLVAKRHETVGELAHASVPDLKESAGGLRDATVMRALVASWLVDVPHADLERGRRGLLDVRDHLHEITGRSGDRIAPEAWAPLAEELGLENAEAAQRHVRMLGRRVAHLSRLTWHRAEAVLDTKARRGPRRPHLTPLAPGVAESGGEVVLDGKVAPADDALLLLRAAAEAAERGLLLSPVSAARLVAECPPLPTPWPAQARELLVRLLASGRGLLGVWETMEETGALDQVLPEWEEIRLLPHASAIHRFTVDRHVVETCIEAARLIRRVARPDLLMVAALLHDIGKGQTLDHSVAGEQMIGPITARMGFDADDRATLATLVRWHLLLSETATTRDPDDPVTQEDVAAKVGSRLTLSLLTALTEADALAASAKAWSTWRAQLVQSLAARVDRVLATRPEPEVEEGLPTLAVPDDLLAGRSTVHFDVVAGESGPTVTVIAPDRVGLLADVSAVLTLQKAGVRRARVWSQGEWGVSVWDVTHDSLDAALLRRRFDLVVAGEGGVDRLKPAAGDVLEPTVQVRPEASRRATVLEVRAGDRTGLLHTVLSAVASRGMTVRSAHVDTVGPQAVDVFYLCELGADALRDERAAEAAHAVRRALAGEVEREVERAR
ncbi:[protein-PII] uridylyltransferase [Nocardioides jishulii]|uniref:Bifunctional uridylyltransferase/uridylyl-removing enzyme n=1 Tax=Nocardioides jishulii TaxID=2575440 RepID=A0A4U2YK64_9ACTN|nr:[protein-PII] uridylyltransferase [Nocardioides jishulii]QCX27046.1 [protein-PII] uridylyltransferase [Nocardioides jishulii]TKI61528.1 [protein-PII] uridylyltransferase [Nocardioides jishulii]